MTYNLAVFSPNNELKKIALDNIFFIFGNVLVTKKGDVNGDGNVNVLDLITIANSIGSKPGQPDWNPNADIREDETINVLDLIKVAVNLGT